MLQPGMFEFRSKLVLIMHGALCALASLSLLSLTACRKEQPAAPRSPEVAVVQVVQKDVPIVHEWVGTADGLVNATIRAQVTGYLIRQAYQEGDLVKKGQLLVELDCSEPEALMAEAKARRVTANPWLSCRKGPPTASSHRRAVPSTLTVSS